MGNTTGKKVFVDFEWNHEKFNPYTGKICQISARTEDGEEFNELANCGELIKFLKSSLDQEAIDRADEINDVLSKFHAWLNHHNIDKFVGHGTDMDRKILFLHLKKMKNEKIKEKFEDIKWFDTLDLCRKKQFELGKKGPAKCSLQEFWKWTFSDDDGKISKEIKWHNAIHDVRATNSIFEDQVGDKNIDDEFDYFHRIHFSK